MKTAEYLKQLEDEVQSLLNGDVFSKCDYSTYDSLTENFGVLFREIDEQRKVIERQQQERIEANRLIDALEQEIDQLTGKSRLQRMEVSEGVNIKQAENLSEVEKRAIDQLIMDIQENEWYCLQGGSESQMEDWEKKLIIDGLKRLLEEEE